VFFSRLISTAEQLQLFIGSDCIVIPMLTEWPEKKPFILTTIKFFFGSYMQAAI
jgi:hypothetical protein